MHDNNINSAKNSTAFMRESLSQQRPTIVISSCAARRKSRKIARAEIDAGSSTLP
jgi:hypothetical protein